MSEVYSDSFKGTTICAVKRDGKIAVAGDGQVTAGESVIMKGNAVKVRRIYDGKVVIGFAGTVADAFTLEEKFEERNLQMVVHFDEEEAIICADGRRLWRVLENVFGNVSKYAMENTRVYVDMNVNRPNVRLSLKNISAQPLNITADELTERFIRGDVSRNTVYRERPCAAAGWDI